MSIRPQAGYIACYRWNINRRKIPLIVSEWPISEFLNGQESPQTMFSEVKGTFRKGDYFLKDLILGPRKLHA